jgi:broad specificity phosphatase PhoE
VPVPRLVGLRDGPTAVTLVRHAESVGNVADADAQQREADELDLDVRDADVELSDRGCEQAEALRRWLDEAPPAERPSVVIASPYRRAADTARLAVAGLDLDVLLDERLRERDLGIFDGLTGKGIRSRYESEARRRKKVGKFYYQPPSGESWADVVLRVRSLLGDLRVGFEDAHVWLFTHQAVILAFRYVLEGLTEEQLMDIDRSTQIENVSLTTYRPTDGGLELGVFGDSTPLERSETEKTAEPSATEGSTGG